MDFYQNTKWQEDCSLEKSIKKYYVKELQGFKIHNWKVTMLKNKYTKITGARKKEKSFMVLKLTAPFT
jgi:hypothetical protein